MVAEAPARSLSQRVLDGIERAGNRAPHPVMIFVYLIGIVIALSIVLDLVGVSVTEEVLVPADVVAEEDWLGGSVESVTRTEFSDEYVMVEQVVTVRSLISVDGIRFIFTSFVDNFAQFSVVAVIFVAMIGVGVAEQAGLMSALIRGLVRVAPPRWLALMIVLIGALSSVATDAGYLILIPLGGAAFMSVGRHPLAGVAAAFAGVGAIFSVNVLLMPADALLTEMTNEAIRTVDPSQSITIGANIYFAIASTLVLTVVVALVTERMVEPRLGTWVPPRPEIAPVAATVARTNGAPTNGATPPVAEHGEETTELAGAAAEDDRESRGLRFTLYAVLAGLAVIAVLTLPPGAPLRDPEDGDIIGNTPFMDALIFMITSLFLVAGIGYGIGARTIRSSTDVINAVTSTFAGLAGLIVMLLVIAQFIAYFNYTNMPRALAGGMAHALEQADVRPTILLVGFILVISLITLIMPAILPKWAIFAPVFVPLFMNLGIPPQTVLAAYRIGDSPLVIVTPLMVYLPFVVLVAQRYQPDAGIGTIIALMLPYALITMAVWIVFFVIWFLLGIPTGPGYPV